MDNRIIKMHLWIILSGFTNHASSEDPPAPSSANDFAPKVTATCKGVTMNTKVVFNSAYNGEVHARDYRNPNCIALGNGSTSVALSLNLQAKQNQPDYCGILVSNVSQDN